MMMKKIREIISVAADIITIIVSAAIPIILMVVGIVSNCHILKNIGVFFLIAFFVFFFFRFFAFYRGVFAVSAIIFDEKDNILLIKDDVDGELYKQPGEHYKTNRFAFSYRKKLKTPYEFIREVIINETGLDDAEFELISLPFDANYTEPKLSELRGNEGRDFGPYKENFLTPAPWCIVKEVSEHKKSSGEKFHIDLYYAFRLKKSVDLKNGNILTTITKLKAGETKTHKDLESVIERIMLEYKKMMYPKCNIRFCTFSRSDKKVFWRLSSYCNAGCKYCISKSPTKKEMFGLKVEEIDEVIEKIINEGYKKVVLTGGEPLLVDEILDIVTKLSQDLVPERISICTNGLVNDLNLINSLCKFEKIDKFVVSVDSYDNNDYIRQKGLKRTGNNNELNNVIQFINTIRGKQKHVTVNVVASKSFIDHPEKFVDFWRKNCFKDISISYPVGINDDFKHRLLDIYNSIINGDYGDVSFCNNMELIIPDCGFEKCQSGDGIHSIVGKTFYDHCIDKTH